MKYIYLCFMMFISASVNAVVVTSTVNNISELATWNDADSPLIDGDTLIKINTGLNECPSGVYIKKSDNSSSILSVALTAYTTNKAVKFQVWNNSSRFWQGATVPYCQVRAIIM